MLMIGSTEIGGGFVRRSFTANGERLKVGDPLSASKIKSWPNQHTLIETGMITVYPPSGSGGGERHVVHNGGGRYDVIVGHKLNDRAMSKEEAEDLATRPDS